MGELDICLKCGAEHSPGPCPVCGDGGIVVGKKMPAEWWADVFGLKRGRVLLDALHTINGERQDQYGSPEDSFALIAEYWTVYLRGQGAWGWSKSMRPEDVAAMMVLFKLARQANQHKRDNLLDAAGYLGIWADMEDKP